MLQNVENSLFWPISWAIIIALTLPVFSCNGDSFEECSKRGRPTYYDRETKEWHCDDKGTQ